MGNRTAKFISALIGSIIAGAPLAAVSQNAPSAPAAASAANAAGDCLASPKGAAPQGQHWFYRVERSTKRQCWYLRADGGKAATTTQTASTAPQPDSPPQSVQDAHAEYIAPQSGAAASARAPAAAATPQAPGTTANSDTQQPAVAARWPDAAATAAAPAPQPVAAPATSPVQPSAKPAASPAPVTLAAAYRAADKPTGSLQTLLLVIVSALALAGLIASMIYRFAGARVRAQAGERRVNWDHRQDHDDDRAPWLNAAPASAPRAERPRPVDFDAACPQAPQIAAFTDAIGRIASPRPAQVAAAEPDETEIEFFDGEFEIEARSPQLAADDEEPADRGVDTHEEDAREENAVDIDIITAMLERLASEGPRLSQPSLGADPAELAQSRRGQSAARA
jgi:hypothetical protein